MHYYQKSFQVRSGFDYIIVALVRSDSGDTVSKSTTLRKMLSGEELKVTIVGPREISNNRRNIYSSKVSVCGEDSTKSTRRKFKVLKKYIFLILMRNFV